MNLGAPVDHHEGVCHRLIDSIDVYALISDVMPDHNIPIVSLHVYAAGLTSNNSNRRLNPWSILYPTTTLAIL